MASTEFILISHHCKVGKCYVESSSVGDSLRSSLWFWLQAQRLLKYTKRYGKNLATKEIPYKLLRFCLGWDLFTFKWGRTHALVAGVISVWSCQGKQPALHDLWRPKKNEGECWLCETGASFSGNLVFEVPPPLSFVNLSSPHKTPLTFPSQSP